MSPDWSEQEQAVPYSHLDNPQSLNLYIYVGNNPLSKPDLDGHGCPPDCGDPTVPTAVAPPSLLSSAFDTLSKGLQSAVTTVASAASVAVGLIRTDLDLQDEYGTPPARVTPPSAENDEIPEESEASTMRAGQRQAMREEEIPTSQQPSSQSNTEAGRQYTYEVPKAGGGTETKLVQRNNGTDRSHPGQMHVEAGRPKANGQTDRIGRPRLDNNKTKVKVKKPDGQ